MSCFEPFHVEAMRACERGDKTPRLLRGEVETPLAFREGADLSPNWSGNPREHRTRKTYARGFRVRRGDFRVGPCSRP